MALLASLMARACSYSAAGGLAELPELPFLLGPAVTAVLQAVVVVAVAQALMEFVTRAKVGTVQTVDVM
jgi:hypothetical protein